MKGKVMLWLVAVLTLTFSALPACAVINNVSVDELGNMEIDSVGPASSLLLLGVGTNVPLFGINGLTYVLPFSPVTGDVELVETSGNISDVVRFLSGDDAASLGVTGVPGLLIFYSDIDADAANPSDLADTGWPAFLTNLATTPHSAGEPSGQEHSQWNPGVGQPGRFPDSEGNHVGYTLYSEVPLPGTPTNPIIPEPITLLGLTLGVGLGLLRKHRSL